MHEIIFYENEKGENSVIEYIKSLANQNGKDSRIKLKKIYEYLKILEVNGKTAGEPYMKHLDDEKWELRPLSDRILFAGYVNDSFVILHHFQKKTQKTPSREIKKAKKELADFIERCDQNDQY